MESLPRRFVDTIVALYGEDGERWLAGLPDLVAWCEQRWSLRAGKPLANLSYNYIAPAPRADGAEVMLKIGVPNPELTSEIEALRRYDGRGCARLLAVDHKRGALLLERLLPGTTLLEVEDDEAETRIAAGIMGQLWRPLPAEHPFPTVHRWARGLERLRARFDGGTGPLPGDLVAKAEGLFVELLASMDGMVLLHGDLHQENILRARRAPWLAIDPKGLAGEPAYEVGALLRNMSPELLAEPQPSRTVARRVDILVEALGFERQRLLGWGLAQAILAAWWCIEDTTPGWEQFIRCAELMDEVIG
jgi:streptomycin 6-kinase